MLERMKLSRKDRLLLKASIDRLQQLAVATIVGILVYLASFSACHLSSSMAKVSSAYAMEKLPEVCCYSSFFVSFQCAKKFREWREGTGSGFSLRDVKLSGILRHLTKVLILVAFQLLYFKDLKLLANFGFEFLWSAGAICVVLIFQPNRMYQWLSDYFE